MHRTERCPKCPGFIDRHVRVFSDLLCIDVEDCYRPNIIDILNKHRKQSQGALTAAVTKIKEIPKVISIDDSTFRLLGFIALYCNTGHQDEMAHYFSFYYHQTVNEWEKRDDLGRKSDIVTRFSDGSSFCNSYLKIALLFYVRD